MAQGTKERKGPSKLIPKKKLLEKLFFQFGNTSRARYITAKNHDANALNAIFWYG